jgi:hypothetical protein
LDWLKVQGSRFKADIRAPFNLEPSTFNPSTGEGCRFNVQGGHPGALQPGTFNFQPVKKDGRAGDNPVPVSVL